MSRLKDSVWNLHLSLDEARRNEEVVAIGESTVVRFIDDINNIRGANESIAEVRAKIRALKGLETTAANRKQIKKLYKQLDNLQFIPDYVCIVIDKTRDFHRANKGFYINGVRYRRFLGTPNGVKKKTVVYVSEKVYGELWRRVENGRNPDKELIPEKYEAYKALACSASIPVPDPRKVLVVKDCITTFKSQVLRLDDTGDGEPALDLVEDYEVALNNSDGCGLILPSLSLRWSNHLGQDYMSSGFCIRNSFCKGMVFCFDFHDFADKVAQNYMVRDVWGNEHDIRDVDLILTESMLKLWDCYDSIDDYMRNCKKNGYTFSVTKSCPQFLENERNLNYQFIQSFDLDDNDIRELLAPTVDEIHDIICGDYRKSILFLRGNNLNSKNAYGGEFDFVKALMIDERMIDDPFVRAKLQHMLHKRINDAKVGVVKVRGNFSIVAGDPYALCQSIFGLKVTGLLKGGEFYSKYWSDLGVDNVVAFRAPMSCHNNVRKLNIARGEQLSYWYRYMNVVTVFNAWDTTAYALNGLDFDSDAILTTDNAVLLSKHKELPALVCIQRKAKKKIITEENLVQANINSFDDEIGQTTNRITSMYEVRSKFSVGSDEYNTLTYRICCGQLFQQNCIDKTKGIVAKSMPKYWYDKRACDKDEYNLSVLADKKPYFMCYIYPQLMSRYKLYQKNTNKKSIRLFGLTIDELVALEEKTEEQREFLKYYYQLMPVGMNDCALNKIAKIVECEFNNNAQRVANPDFDYSILKSDTEYNQQRYNAVKKIYDTYVQTIQNYKQVSKRTRIDNEDAVLLRALMIDYFKRECFKACNNQYELTNIVLDICYTSNKSKQFAWDVCGRTIIENLLKKNNYIIQYPTQDEDGYIDFGGEKFVMAEKDVSDGYTQ